MEQFDRETIEVEAIIVPVDVTVEPGDRGAKGPSGPVGAAR